MQQGLLEDVRDVGLLQPAGPMPGVEQRFNAVRIFPGMTRLFPETVHHFGRNGIGQPKCHGLD